ncbi:hypothetical protein MLD38_010979 [Melastoma candidum]|uniref:Uncharacterized protein n=1 Tax=Melastoma candidum TaxID=119954 RepID=A0ACB9R1M0_9MYRT|nr:hypothetical protein MLD38_010979 [Melastoma candidum]
MEKAKKKPAPALIKPPQLHSTPRRTSKPTPISPAPSMTNSLRKPAIDVSAKRNKGGPALDLKKETPHYGKDGRQRYHKRAFRTFQNHAELSKSFSEQKSAPLALAGYASSTIRKENMRRESGTAVKKSNEVSPSKYGSANIKRVEKSIENINKKPEQKQKITTQKGPKGDRCPETH